MPLFPKDSPIKVDAELEKRILSSNSTSEIIALMHDEMLQQGLVRPDGYDPLGNNWTTMHEVVQPVVSANTPLAKSIIVDGVKHVIEGATEAELVAAELALMRSLFSKPITNEQPRGQDGKFVAAREEDDTDDVIVNPADQVSADVVRRALEAQGIDVNALKDFTAAKQDEKDIASWTTAGTQFRERHPEWLGGTENQKVIQDLIAENDLIGTEDRLAALEAVYKHAIKNNMLKEPAENVAARKISAATTPEELREALGRPAVTDYRATGRGFFGR